MPMLDMPLEELIHYRGISPRPPDYDAYWAEAIGELDAVDPDARLAPAEFSARGAKCYDLTFTGVRGARLYAKYLRPEDAGRYPCVLAFHGYTMSSGDWTQYLPYVMQNVAVAAMDCRGQGGQSALEGGLSGGPSRGFIVRGALDSPQDMYFRHAYLDAAQLHRAVSALDEIDEARISAMGASQGGALALAVGALTGRVRRAAVQYPFLSDFKRTWQLGLGGNAYQEIYDYFRRFDPMHERADAFFRRLGYIDIRFMAERFAGDVLMAIALMDKTCPPSTSFAAYNALPGDRQLCVFPDFDHENLPRFSDRAFAFLTEQQGK